MRLRTILIQAAVPAAVALLAGCGGSSRGGGGGTRVVAGFYPLAFAAQEVGGSRVQVENLTPPGAEPHDLELTPSDVSDVERADLVLLLGRGFQPQLEDAAGGSSKVLRLLDVPGLRVFPGNDPHVWLDPLRYAVIVRRIGTALHRPAAADALVARLRALDARFRRGLARCARREIVTGHAAFAYLAQRYGFRQLAITGLAPEAEPTPRALQRVEQEVRQSGATTVYFETLVSPKLAQTVARATGATTAELDPIEGLTAAEQQAGDNYFTLMRRNLAALRRGLSCR